MKIVIAVSERDLELAEAQSELLLKLGGLGAHHCLLVVAPEITHRDGPLASNLQKAFGTFERIEVKNVADYGTNVHQPHVVAANQMFQAAVRHFATTGNQVEWYWFEPDCVPLNERWADELSRDYLTSVAMRRPFLGKFVPKVEVVTSAEGQTLKVVPGEVFMVGTGIYPARLDKVSGLWSQARTVPWDVLMQWETSPRGTNTDKIIHNHATKSYTVVEPGVLQCQLASTPSRSLERLSVPKEALVIHGCKDTSLIDIVSSGGLYSDKPPTTAAPKQKKQKTPKSNSELTVE